MLNQKLRPPSHWERQVAKYARKEEAAKSPTQRAYANQMKRAAERSLLASRGGAEVVEPDDAVDLQPTEYREV